jgi:hypothetical protein
LTPTPAYDVQRMRHQLTTAIQMAHWIQLGEIDVRLPAGL